MASASLRARRVLPSLYLANFEYARSARTLKAFQITDVIILAYEPWPEELSRTSGTVQKTLHVPLRDSPDQHLDHTIPEAYRFFKTALLTRSSPRVLVHAVNGNSRTVAVVIGLLLHMSYDPDLAQMLEKMGDVESVFAPLAVAGAVTVENALQLVKDVYASAAPNVGFIKQLHALEARLQEHAESGSDRGSSALPMAVPAAVAVTPGRARRSPDATRKSAVRVKREYGAYRVSTGLYLSSASVAEDDDALVQLGVTHIVNCCKERPPTAFAQSRCSVLSLAMLDTPTQGLTTLLDETLGFIGEALSDERNRVLVHCNAGISRSAAVVVAYVALARSMSLADSLQYVKARKPDISPNFGFIEQLLTWEEQNIGPRSVDVAMYKAEQLSEMFGCDIKTALSALRRADLDPQRAASLLLASMQ